MKNIRYALIILWLSILAISCAKISDGTGGPWCKDVVCMNAGSCVKGNCLCEYGWTGPHCEIRATGKIRIFNSLTNTYKIEINGENKGTLAPNTEVYHVVEIGTYSCKATEQRTDTLPPTVRSFDNVKVFPHETKPLTIN